LEEEARVFHVAVTRAQQQLYMTTPTLGRDAEGRLSGLRPSRFVEGLAQAGWVERGVVQG
jgi:superfamily I DNA/RNA helicase